VVISPGPILTVERRAGSRYPIRAGIRYRLLAERRVVRAGTGSLVNISRSGLLFESAQPIAPGSRIEIEVDWPARTLKMVLRVAGETVRSQGNQTAIRILRSAFRVDRAGGRAGRGPAPL
jgi:hypothetical protein